MKRIETDRLIIRKFTLDDAQLIYELSNEESLKKFLPDQVYADINQAKETLEFLISKYERISFPYVMAVVEKSSGVLIGHAGLSKVDKGIEIGYAIGMKYQRKGYAKEAVNAYTDWAKVNLGLDKIYGLVEVDNSASIKVLIGSGYMPAPHNIRQESIKLKNKDVYLK